MNQRLVKESRTAFDNRNVTNNEFQHSALIAKLPQEYHPFFTELITRSNQWDKTIEKILLSHNLMN